MDQLGSAGYRRVRDGETERANRAWWDGEAQAYLAEHGEFLGADRLIWCPEGVDERAVALLGEVTGRRLLEVGSGAGQGTRWAQTQGAQAVGIDVSIGMLQSGRDLDQHLGRRTSVVQADAQHLPFADESFDLAFSAYGALPFIADVEQVFLEVRRVLRPRGRWVFAVTHPVRWAFPDNPGPDGLTVNRSYFDRTPYVESSEAGRVLYAEHHRTMGDWVRHISDSGFVLERLVEPEWRPENEGTWGGWSPLRGRLLPGTAIFCTRNR